MHMYIAIPPLMCFRVYVISEGKSTLMLFDRHPEYRSKWGDRSIFGREGVTVSTVGNVNEGNGKEIHGNRKKTISKKMEE